MSSDAFAVRNGALNNEASVEEAKAERHVHADVWPCGGRQDVLSKAPLYPEPKQPYDKRSYQDKDSASDAEGKSVVSADGSTLIEDKDEQNRVVFDDDDTWNDQDDSVVRTPGKSDGSARGSTLPERALLRKVAALDRGTLPGSTSQESDPPPASELMTRLFPSLKPKAPNPPPPPPPELKNPQEETGEADM